MLQQGQVFKLRGGDGRDVWAFRYRLGGRGSRRVQRGGFASERDASEALERAVVWGMIDVNPAKQGVDNPQRRYTEKRPFESWARARRARRRARLLLWADGDVRGRDRAAAGRVDRTRTT